MNVSKRMKRTIICSILLMLVCLAAVTFIAGCTSTRPDPENGVRTWITAVNDRNYSHVYAMAPRGIRQQVTEADFIAAQETNPLLSPGNRIGDYTILERTASGDTATITARLLLVTPGSGNATATTVPVYLKFIEQFEDGEWKIWTVAP
jgi:hypothetical protein